MKTRAAVLWDRQTDWSVGEIDLDPPKAGEVLVEMGGSGLCHSDEHVLTGDLPWPLPMIGGHEGARVIQEVGPGVSDLAPGDQIAASLAMVGKRGRAVVTNLHRATETQVSMSALDLMLLEKQVRGSLFGSSNPRSDIPRMLELYRSGKLKLEELRTRTHSLDDINEGYDDMRNSRSLRGVISFG